MSDLSAHISKLRGTLSSTEAAAKGGQSRETFLRIQRGEGRSVKLSSLRKIADGYKLPQAEWLSLLVAWIKDHIGTDATRLWIEPRDDKPSKLRDAESNMTAQAMMLFTQLPISDRRQIIHAMERKEVMDSIAAINQVWDKVDRKNSPKPKPGT